MKQTLGKLVSSYLLCAAIFAASEGQTKTSLFKTPEESTKVEALKDASHSNLIKNSDKPKKANTSITNNSSGLISRQWSMVTSMPTMLIAQGAGEVLKPFKVGEVYLIDVPMSLLAFAEGKAPVVANLDLANGESFRLLGEATLERNSKRVQLEFQKIRRSASMDVFDLKAQALDHDGTYGIEGEVHSGEGKFFLAEILSAAAAGFVDASVTRSTNAFGNPVEDRSLSNQGLKAVTGAMSKSAEHFGEKLKQATEYVTVDGPLAVRMLIVEGPRRKLQP